MHKSVLMTLSGAFAGLALGGCATIFTGTTDWISFDSNVPGVRLTLDGQLRGELPIRLEQSRSSVGGRQFVARFEKEGYATQEFRLNQDFNPVALLDLSSTVVSGGVDVLTGALFKFSPTEYHVQMVEQGKDPHSREAQRSRELYEFALVNWRRLQSDLARGGGEHLSTLAVLLGEEPARKHRIEAALVAHSPRLVAQSTAHRFLDQLQTVVGWRAVTDKSVAGVNVRGLQPGLQVLTYKPL